MGETDIAVNLNQSQVCSIYIHVTGLYCICKLFNTIIIIDETDVAVRDGFQNNNVLLYFVKRIAWYCDPEFSPNFRKSTKPATLL